MYQEKWLDNLDIFVIFICLKFMLVADTRKNSSFATTNLKDNIVFSMDSLKYCIL